MNLKDFQSKIKEYEVLLFATGLCFVFLCFGISCLRMPEAFEGEGLRKLNKMMERTSTVEDIKLSVESNRENTELNRLKIDMLSQIEEQNVRNNQ